MYNLIEDVLKVKLQKEINGNIQKLGLQVSNIKLLEDKSFDIIIEIIDIDRTPIKSSCEIAS